jgi:hypothetical protein
MLSLTASDLRRVGWTFVMTAGAYAVAAWTNLVPGQPFEWKTVAVGAIAAGLSALKNAPLPEGSNLK